MPRIRTLEICVEDLDGVDAAVAGGADRIELCTALAVGGLTPAASLIRAAASAALPVHLLSRPREGGFVYTPRESAMIADDITTAAEAGLAGVVIGAANVDGTLDAAVLAELIAHARLLGKARGRDLSLTLHRAFDLVPDLGAALDTAVTLGFDRVLTSGGAPKAVDGVAAIAMLHRRAAGRIGILVGSGVSIDTLPAILATGVGEVHASCRHPCDQDQDPALIRFGFASTQASRTGRGRIRDLATHLAHSNA